MDKAERERHALRCVYNEDDFQSVIHQDSPDFILQKSTDSLRFGVEVTDIYESGADARVAWHPEYISDLLAGGRHMHEDDLNLLPVESVEILDRDGNVKSADIPAIVRPRPSQAVRSAKIRDVLRGKNRRAGVYIGDLDHVNLIMVDRFGSHLHSDDGYYTSDLFGQGVRAELAASDFREVYLASRSHDGSWYYRPLQLLLLLERFELFLGAVQSFESGALEGDLDYPDLVPLFLHSVDNEMKLDFCHEDEHYFARYRATGIFYLETSGVRVMDFRDFQLPEAMPKPKSPIPEGRLTDFKAHFANFMNENVFHAGFMPRSSAR